MFLIYNDIAEKREYIYTWRWMEFECIEIVILVYLVHTEHKNGVNFPDDESVAVSVPNALWVTFFLHFLHTKNTT